MTMFAVGDVLGPWEVAIDRDMVCAYVEVSGDRNPIHLEDMAAEELGLPGVVAHGMLTMGLSLRVLSDNLSTMGAIAAGVGIRYAQAKFIGPLAIPIDDSIIVRVLAEVVETATLQQRFFVESVATVDGAQMRIAKMEVVYG